MTSLREQILNAATRMFADHGYAACSMRQLAEAVGCTKPALYYHFHNKENLFREAVITHSAQYTDLIRTVVERPGTLWERMDHAVQAYLKLLKDNPDGMRLLLVATHSPEKGMPSTDLLTVAQDNDRLLHRLVQAGIESGEIREDVPASLVVLSMVGVFSRLGELSLMGQPTDDAMPGHLLDLLFHGVAP